MSKSYAFDRDAHNESPFASRHATRRNGRDRFESRRLARLASARALALAELDAPAPRD